MYIAVEPSPPTIYTLWQRGQESAFNEPMINETTPSDQTPTERRSGGREEIRNPLRFFLWLTETYGDIVQYRSSVEPAYLINHPDYVRHVLQTNGQNYNKEYLSQQVHVESLTGAGLADQREPAVARAAAAHPARLSQAKPAEVRGLMPQAVPAARSTGWRRPRPGEPVNIAREMMRLTLDIVTEALFGFDITGQADEVGEAMDTMVTIGKPRHRKVREAIDLLDSIVYAIIDERRAPAARAR
jgi:cytochrome P450